MTRVTQESITRAEVLRRNAGGTYVAASAQSGFSAESLSAWLRAKRAPRADRLARLRELTS